MKLLRTLLVVISVSCAMAQDASKFSEAELDKEDQDFAPLSQSFSGRADNGALHHESSKIVSPQRFQAESEGLVEACHKIYWTPIPATDAPTTGFFASMVAGAVAGSEKYIYAVDIQNEASKVHRLDVDEKKWTKITATGAPIPPNTVGAAGTSSKGKILFFGGKVASTQAYSQDVKVIQLNDNAAEWTAISTSGEKNLKVEGQR